MHMHGLDSLYISNSYERQGCEGHILCIGRDKLRTSKYKGY